MAVFEWFIFWLMPGSQVHSICRDTAKKKTPDKTYVCQIYCLWGVKCSWIFTGFGLWPMCLHVRVVNIAPRCWDHWASSLCITSKICWWCSILPSSAHAQWYQLLQEKTRADPTANLLHTMTDESVGFGGLDFGHGIHSSFTCTYRTGEQVSLVVAIYLISCTQGSETGSGHLMWSTDASQHFGFSSLYNWQWSAVTSALAGVRDCMKGMCTCMYTMRVHM